VLRSVGLGWVGFGGVGLVTWVGFAVRMDVMGGWMNVELPAIEELSSPRFSFRGIRNHSCNWRPNFGYETGIGSQFLIGGESSDLFASALSSVCCVAYSLGVYLLRGFE
jgi:hypothetical protein